MRRTASAFARRPRDTQPRAPSHAGRRPAARRFARDEGGAVLLLAGLLLVLGFLTVAGVILYHQDAAETTARIQRTSIVSDVNQLVEEFNKSVAKAVRLGDTNLTDFKERALEAESILRAGAIGRGIYIEARLDPSPDPSVFWRESRCGAYDADRTEDGIVIGYDNATQKESIVGAVYDIHATDGGQTFRFPYYVKLFECLPSTMTHFFSDWTLTEGTLADPDNAQDPDDGDAAARLEEMPIGTYNQDNTIGTLASTMTFNSWNYPENIITNNLLTAQHPATPLNDFIRIKLDTASIPDGVALTNVRVRVDNHGVGIIDDYLQLRVLNGSTVLFTQAVPTTLLETTNIYTLPASPSGSALWTKAELAAVTLELQVIEVGSFDPPAFFQVEYLAATYTLVLPEEYSLDVTFGWPPVPAIFDTYTLSVRYSSDPSPTEDFLIEVWDGTQWNTRITLAPTGPSTWATLDHTLQPNEIADGDLRVRIRDAVDDDALPGSNDVLFIDWLRLTSSITPP